MTMQETLPVVGLTLNYRDARRTQRCLGSLWDNGAEHVLVWDNSDDGGLSAAELQRAVGSDPRWSVVVSKQNLGFARAVNRSLAWLGEHYPNRPVLLINNDAILVPGALRILYGALLDAPASRIIYPRMDHGGSVVGTAYYHRLTGHVHYTRPWPGSFAYASGCCMLVNPALTGTRLLDETFFMYGEDCELCHRLGRIPGAMHHVAQTLVKHEGSASSGMATPFYETQIVAAHLLLAHRVSRNAADLASMLTGRWVMLFCRAVVRSIRYRSGIPSRALWDGWRLSRDALRAAKLAAQTVD
jgi:N-acetylglucosaminyl-diphospho-decaprenol L-rhamnosyltransferase